MSFKLSVALCAASLALAGSAQADEAASPVEASPMHHAALLAAVSDPARGENAARDQFRHPVETLEFFRVAPGMTVVDYFPGNVGWYTDILVPYLGKGGFYIGANATILGASEGGKASQRAFPEKFPQDVNAHLAEVGITGAPVSAINLESLPEGMGGTVDRFLIFRFVHNLHRWGMLHDSLKKARSILKDDGLLGITEHRAKPDAPYSYADGENGYMRQDDVIKLIEGTDSNLSQQAKSTPIPGTAPTTRAAYGSSRRVGGQRTRHSRPSVKAIA